MEYICGRCEQCKCNVFYKTKKPKYSVCEKCRKLLVRKCPECKKEITYKSFFTFRRAQQTNSSCKSCLSSKKIKNVRETHGGFKGENNPFFGKHHSNETKKHLSKVDRSYTKTEEFSEICRAAYKKIKDEPRFHESNYDRWLRKYGKKEADRRRLEDSNKKSIRSSGSDNPMFGKPASKKCGNGYKGWYKGWFFRSLHELTVMIKLIEYFNLKWIPAERKKLRIPYVAYNGSNRTYAADFIIEDKYMLECKPKKLWNTKENILKRAAGIKWCKENQLIYKMIDMGVLKNDEIVFLFESKAITFTKESEKKFKEKYVDKT